MPCFDELGHHLGIALGQSSGEHVISGQCEKCRRSYFDLLDRAHIVNIGGCRYDGITDCRRWPVFARHASSTLLYGYYGTIPGPHSALLDHWLRREQPQRRCWLGSFARQLLRLSTYSRTRQEGQGLRSCDAAIWTQDRRRDVDRHCIYELKLGARLVSCLCLFNNLP